MSPHLSEITNTKHQSYPTTFYHGSLQISSITNKNTKRQDLKSKFGIKLEKIAIAITGISFAGKSAFLRRLRINLFVEKNRRNHGTRYRIHKASKYTLSVIRFGRVSRIQKTRLEKLYPNVTCSDFCI